MKHLFAFAFTAVLLIACSKESSETTVDPDLHPILLNTGNLFSVDGSKLHIAYTSDEKDWRYAYHIKWVTPSTLR